MGELFGSIKSSHSVAETLSSKLTTIYKNSNSWTRKWHIQGLHCSSPHMQLMQKDNSNPGLSGIKLPQSGQSKTQLLPEQSPGATCRSLGPGCSPVACCSVPGRHWLDFYVILQPAAPTSGPAAKMQMKVLNACSVICDHPSRRTKALALLLTKDHNGKPL